MIIKVQINKQLAILRPDTPSHSDTDPLNSITAGFISNLMIPRSIMPKSYRILFVQISLNDFKKLLRKGLFILHIDSALYYSMNFGSYS